MDKPREFEADNGHVGTPIKLDEQKRIYTYAHEKSDGTIETVTSTYEKVVELIIRPSGSHRLVTADGRLHFASAGFIGITIVK